MKDSRFYSSLMLHFQLSFAYLAQFIKTRLEYKADFILGAVSSVTFHAITLIFIDVLFAERTYTMNGWSKAQVFFIYGFSILPQTLFFAFFSNLYAVSDQYIIEGNFDRILLRPLNSLFQILLERVRIESLLGLPVGVVVLIIAGRALQVDWSLLDALLLTGMVFCGVAIYAGVFITLASLSFWWPDRMGLLPPVYNMIAFGKYPVTIYHPFLQFILMWVVPFAFVAFFPSTAFMQRQEFRYYVMLVPVVAFGAMTVAAFFWTMGTRRYESTGS
jgi:ABC-2 type transport system permease protein